MKKRDSKTNSKLQKVGNKRAAYEKARKLKLKNQKIQAESIRLQDAEPK